MALTKIGKEGITGISNASDATAITITSGENVGIGTASPTRKLDVNGSSIVRGFLTTYGTGTNNALFLNNTAYEWAAYTNASNNFVIVDWNLAQTRLTIDTSGGLILSGSTAQKATGTTWSNPSDQRLKTDIRDYTKGSAELMQVRVREWLYNGKGGTVDGITGLGVIADEVMTVLPDTVETYEALLEETDELPTAIKKFDATEITWLLVTSLQEALTEISALKVRVAALEA